MARRPCLRRLLELAVLGIFLYNILPILIRRRGYDVWKDDAPVLQFSQRTAEDACTAFPLGVFDEVQVILKTGAAEVESKLPVHLRAVTACVPDLLIFSDSEEVLNGHLVYNALANLPQDYRRSYEEEFKLYSTIQGLKQAEGRPNKSPEGWKLDKHKFLPMTEMTWSLRPQKKWFLFIEPDTYVVWDNFLRFLRHFDPNKPLYFGSPVWPAGKTVFAHGGSGFVLSRGALRKLFLYGEKFRTAGLIGSHQFGQNMSAQCCGDEALAQTLNRIGIRLKGYWPMFNGETPATVGFGDEQWCEPVLTLHHLSEGETQRLRKWELEREDPAKPLLFEELFSYVEEQLTDVVRDWDNMSGNGEVEVPREAGDLPEDCAQACQRNRKCYQWQHSGRTCRISHTIRLGHGRRPDEGNGDTLVSGWNLKRIREFKRRYSPCGNARWVHSNP